jgi:hypothetical protein
MTILDILRKHQVPDACIADVNALLREVRVDRKINSAEVSQTGIQKLKEYLKRDASRMMAAGFVADLVESELKDADGNTTDIRYTLTVVRNK